MLVEAVNATGAAAYILGLLKAGAASSVAWTAAVAGGGLAVVADLMNNLPAGLIASTAITPAQPPKPVIDALPIGVDLRPNLSITESLATIPWLTAIRPEREAVGFWQFLKVGALVMPLALILAIAARLALTGLPAIIQSATPRPTRSACGRSHTLPDGRTEVTRERLCLILSCEIHQFRRRRSFAFLTLGAEQGAGRVQRRVEAGNKKDGQPAKWRIAPEA